VSAVVTGGGSGIGRAVVGLLRAAGHDAVAWDLRDGDIDCDISDPDAVAAAMRITIAEHGSIVAVSSISGTVADDHMGAYCVSTAGVDMLVKVAAGRDAHAMLATPEQLPGWVEAIAAFGHGHLRKNS
jgi:NAD(P)-dependent dehydrogenase (short-subunit alcohol dehydrogenase family)